MADQGKWFKLWCSSLHDEALENLSLEDWARWARLGAYIKEHGKEGKIRFNPPYRALLNLFRMDKIEDAICSLHEFPNFTIGERTSTVSTVTNATVSYEIEVKNWLKFQGDFSSDRVRKFRDKKRYRETLQEERRSRREEKRGEEKNITPPEPAVRELMDHFLALQEAKIREKPQNFNHGLAGKFFKQLLKTVSVTEIKRRMENWFRSDIPFIVKSSYGISAFQAHFNALREGPINAQTSFGHKPNNAFVADREESGKYT